MLPAARDLGSKAIGVAVELGFVGVVVPLVVPLAAVTGLVCIW